MVGLYDLRIFQYTRGTDWSVKCIVHAYDNITYADVKVPDSVSSYLKEKFLEEAEKATLKKLEESKVSE